MRMVAVKGNSKVAIIIPEIKEAGWQAFAKKITLFVMQGQKKSFKPSDYAREKSYIPITQKDEWPKDEIKIIEDDSVGKSQFRIDASSLRS